jgi:hypothetical protein
MIPNGTCGGRSRDLRKGDEMTFSIERYKEESRKLDTTGVQWDETTRHKLSNGDLFCVHYMMDIAG